MPQSNPDLQAAVRRHLLALTAKDFASHVFNGNDAIEAVELTITRAGVFDDDISIDVSHKATSGFPLEGYSL